MIASPSNREVPTLYRPANEKESDLRSMMRSMRKVLVAYSGGVDSTYLSLIASKELGNNALCVMGISPSVSDFQFSEAVNTAEKFEFNFRTIETDEINIPEYASNPINRCYFCKSELYDCLRSIAESEQIEFILDGTNADDLSDHRPGRAAAGERAIASPLASLGFSKADIRALSKSHGLPTWDKPASPCLSSRIAYGVPVTIERLTKVERGEELIRSMGFREFRLRVHDDLARIEIAAEEMGKALDVAVMRKLADDIKKTGFRYVTLDLNGFRSGAMNETIKVEKTK